MPKKTPPEADESAATETPAAPESPGPDPAETPQHGARFFAWIRSLGLVRQSGWVGGVASGIADRIGIDVVIVRGILVVIALIGGPAILLYAVAWLLLPDERNRIHLEDLLRGKVDSPVIGIAVLVALSLLPVTQGFWWFGSLYWGQPQVGNSLGRAIWTIVILGLLVGFVVWMSRRAGRSASTATASTGAVPASDPAAAATAVIPEPSEPPAPPAEGASPDAIANWRETQATWKAQHEAFRGQQAAQHQAASEAAANAARVERVARSLEYRERQARTRSNPVYSTALIGIALVAGAITALLLDGGTLAPVDVLTGLAVAVGVLGLGIILNGAMGRRSGGATGMAILLILPLIAAAIFPQSDTVNYQGATVRTLHYSVADPERTYYQVSGDVTLSLADYFAGVTAGSQSRPTANRIELWVGAGNVRVVVPANQFEYLSARSASGVITDPSGSRHHSDWSGAVSRSGAQKARELDVAVYVASGNVTFIAAPATNGAAQ